MSLRKTVLFDIDGTLADIAHRRPYLQSDRPDWKRFNDGMGDDTPNTAIVSLYKTLRQSEAYELILVSGRSEQYRSITQHWLTWNEIQFSRLLMRKENDVHSDVIIKEEILHKLLSEGLQIEFVVDDRQQVVDMWRRNGITCLQCDVGDF